MPSTYLIIGGSGRVARQLTRLLVSKHGHSVHSVIRSSEQLDSIKSLGARPILQSIETATVADLVGTIKSVSPDAVIWSAGAGGKGGPERTDAVDRVAAIKCFDAMVQAGGTKRLVVVSAVDVRDREGSAPEPQWYNDEDQEKSERMWSAIGPFFRAKVAADKDLVTGNEDRNLQYTIVRPGSLSDESGTGKVAAGKIHISPAISREDVAAVIIECLNNANTAGLAFDVVGGDEPIPDAVRRVAEGRIDTFEGHY